MTLRWLVAEARLALACLTIGVAIPIAATADNDEPRRLREAAEPAFSIPGPAPPAPQWILERLPPGARTGGLEAAPAGSREGDPDSARSEHIQADRGLADSGLAQKFWYEVEYTVDPSLDRRMRHILDDGDVSLAHVVVMDPKTGAILSYVSTDPGRFPATRPYPAASLTKVVTAAAALRKAPEALRRTCRYRGSPYEVLTAHLVPPVRGGVMASFTDAMVISNNQCFARLAVHTVGEEDLRTELIRSGFLETPGALHHPGRVEPVDTPLALGHLGSGLAGAFITPLAAVRLAGALVNGELFSPYWVAAVRDSDGPLALPPLPEPVPVWTPAIARELRELLARVPVDGTARRAFHDARGDPLLGSVSVAGKTGTLSGSDPVGRYRWFIGVAPAQSPQIAIAAINIEREGGRNAPDVAAAALHEVFCAEGQCLPENAGPLLARVETRAGEIARAIEEREQARALRALSLAQKLSEPEPLPELDEQPRPIGAPGLRFPRRLRKNHVEGRIVLLLDLDREGRVHRAHIESSDLPDFDELVLAQVKDWRFTPPRRGGESVEARARLPIPIRIGRTAN